MKVVNVHQRLLHAAPERVGALIDSIASAHDGLWPGNGWPRMRLDRPLAVGAAGGHGPIGYFVEAYAPGRSVRFQFTAPHGFDGWHAFEVLDATAAHCVLEHRIEMRTATLRATLLWSLGIRWLHDACLRDLMAQAELSLGHPPRRRPWSPYVRMLMAVLSSRRAPRVGARRSHAR